MFLFVSVVVLRYLFIFAWLRHHVDEEGALARSRSGAAAGHSAQLFHSILGNAASLPVCGLARTRTVVCSDHVGRVARFFLSSLTLQAAQRYQEPPFCIARPEWILQYSDDIGNALNTAAHEGATRVCLGTSA